MDSVSHGGVASLGRRFALGFWLTILVLVATVDGRLLKFFPSSQESQGIHNDGAISYPISRDMGYNGDWNVFREQHGPNVIPEDGYLRYSVENSSGDDGWVFVDLDPMLDSDGSALMFKLRLNSMSGEEVQFTILANLVLRVMNGGSYVEWARWTGEGFEKLADSEIGPGEQWHQILVRASRDGFTLIENGKTLFKMDKLLDGDVQNTFHMSAVTSGTSVSMDLSDILSIPGQWKARMRENFLESQDEQSGNLEVFG